MEAEEEEDIRRGECGEGGEAERAKYRYRSDASRLTHES